MITGVINYEPDEAVARINEAAVNVFGSAGVENDKLGNRTLVYYLQEKGRLSKIPIDLGLEIQIELWPSENNSTQTNIRLSLYYSKIFSISILFLLGLLLLASRVLFIVLCIFLLFSQISIEDWAWKELEKAVRVSIMRNPKFTDSSTGWYRSAAVIWSICIAALQGLAFCLIGFPVPLAIVIFLTSMLATTLAKFFAADRYDAKKKKIAELQLSWVTSIIIFQMILVGSVVLIWNLLILLPDLISHMSVLDYSSPTSIVDALSELTNIVSFSWYPFSTQDTSIRPETISWIQEHTSHLTQGYSQLLIVFVYLILVVAIGTPLSECLKNYRFYLKEFPAKEKYVSRRRTVRASWSLKAVLVLLLATNVLAILATITIVITFLMALFAPTIARQYRFTMPFLQFGQILDSIFDPLSSSAKIHVGILLSVPIILAFVPGILFPLFASFRTRSLYWRYSCSHPDILQTIRDFSNKLGVKYDVQVAVIPQLSDKLRAKDKILSLLHTRTYSVLRRRVLIVLAEELLNTRVIPRNVLNAALAHEIAHAAEDLRFFDFLARLSSLSGFGRGYLSLLIDYHEIEFHADEKAARCVEDYQLVVEAIRGLTDFQTIREMSFSKLPKPKSILHKLLGIWHDLLGMFSFMFESKVPSIAYPDDETRIQRLEEKFSRKSIVSG
jgi:Zn-dependent protease with chaperone function